MKTKWKVLGCVLCAVVVFLVFVNGAAAATLACALNMDSSVTKCSASGSVTCESFGPDFHDTSTLGGLFGRTCVRPATPVKDQTPPCTYAGEVDVYYSSKVAVTADLGKPPSISDASKENHKTQCYYYTNTALNATSPDSASWRLLSSSGSEAPSTIDYSTTKWCLYISTYEKASAGFQMGAVFENNKCVKVEDKNITFNIGTAKYNAISIVPVNKSRKITPVLNAQLGTDAFAHCFSRAKPDGNTIKYEKPIDGNLTNVTDKTCVVRVCHNMGKDTATNKTKLRCDTEVVYSVGKTDPERKLHKFNASVPAAGTGGTVPSASVGISCVSTQEKNAEGVCVDKITKESTQSDLTDCKGSEGRSVAGCYAELSSQECTWVSGRWSGGVCTPPAGEEKFTQTPEQAKEALSNCLAGGESPQDCAAKSVSPENCASLGLGQNSRTGDCLTNAAVPGKFDCYNGGASAHIYVNSLSDCDLSGHPRTTNEATCSLVNKVLKDGHCVFPWEAEGTNLDQWCAKQGGSMAGGVCTTAAPDATSVPTSRAGCAARGWIWTGGQSTGTCTQPNSDLSQYAGMNNSQGACPQGYQQVTTGQTYRCDQLPNQNQYGQQQGQQQQRPPQQGQGQPNTFGQPQQQPGQCQQGYEFRNGQCQQQQQQCPQYPTNYVNPFSQCAKTKDEYGKMIDYYNQKVLPAYNDGVRAYSDALSNHQCVKPPDVPQAPTTCYDNTTPNPTPDTGATPTASFDSCTSPLGKIAEAGMPITFKYHCDGSTGVEGVGFTARNFSSSNGTISGTDTEAAAAAPAGTDTATFGLVCRNGTKTANAQCTINVVTPRIVFTALPSVFTPAQVSSGVSTTTLGWITTHDSMKSCRILIPGTNLTAQERQFNEDNKNNTSVNGMANFVVKKTTTFNVVCTTIGGNTKTAPQLVEVK